jgi:putative SOS response-associated peptidase YedK
MPIILNRVDEDGWLSENSRTHELLSLLKPYPSSMMQTYPVSKKVNDPRNDNVKLIRSLKMKV